MGHDPLLSNPNFLKLWAAQTISHLGSQVTQLALPLTAILIMEASSFEIGVLGALQFVPPLVLGLSVGVIADRLPRRKILIASDIARALILTTIPLAYALGRVTIWQLYVVALLTGFFNMLFEVTYLSYLPSLVERRRLMQGNARLATSRSGAQIAGSTLGGFLINTLSAPMAILVDAISFLISGTFLVAMRKTHEEATPKPSRPPMIADIREGIMYVLRQRLLWPITASAMLTNFSASIIDAVYLLFAVRLGVAPITIGLIFAAGNVGFLLGAVSVNRITRRFGLGRTLTGAVVGLPIAFAMAPAATVGAAVPFLLGRQLLSYFCMPLFNVNQVSLRQAITPDELQGRMNATVRFLAYGTIPIGLILGGWLGTAIGLRATLWVGSLIAATSVISIVLSPVRSLRRISHLA